MCMRVPPCKTCSAPSNDVFLHLLHRGRLKPEKTTWNKEIREGTKNMKIKEGSKNMKIKEGSKNMKIKEDQKT